MSGPSMESYYMYIGFHRSEVLRRKSVQDFVRQDGDLELNPLRDTQPMQTD